LKKDRKHNGQNKHDLQNTTQKTNDRAAPTHTKARGELRC